MKTVAPESRSAILMRLFDYCHRRTLKLSMTARTAVPACLNASNGSTSQEPLAAKTIGRKYGIAGKGA
ncbi:hypothetical protein [Achromobacter xylosoxidans]|uniref:hypothetical protein n=1 Tax=Alcaligenes xylosoxydans xylosoxydans TaxID=85698 RepID=UPI0011D185D8|nr:hypothetical protein [Achromobacter xylosoxidans]